MYDSFLFGYGLTLAINFKLSNSALITPQQKQILNFDSFFRTFISSGKREKLYRQFIALLRVESDKAELHEKMRIKLEARIDEITNYGFERWVSKNLFDPNNQVDSEEKMYMYILHCFWTHLVHEEILRRPKIQKPLKAIASEIQKEIRPNGKIFTTTFDTILDRFLRPQHLHGTAPIPLVNPGEIILEIFPNGKDWEYSYLFGANGLEKLARLDKIRQLSQNKYQLDFFYSPEIDLGHLLIYGLSFGKTESISNEFLEAYPEHENFYLSRSVDGHILLKLNERYQKGLLSKVTVSYYTLQDLEHLRYFFSMTDLMPTVEFKHATEIFQI